MTAAPHTQPTRLEGILWIALGVELLLVVVSLVTLASATDTFAPTISLFAFLLAAAGTLPPAAILCGMREMERSRH